MILTQTRSVKFTQELYNNFEYVKPRPFFHTFETEECVAGFSFADEGEADDFFSKVLQCRNTPAAKMAHQQESSTPASRPPPAPSSPSPAPAPVQSSSPSSSNLNTSSSNNTLRKEKKKKGGFMSFFKGEDDDDLMPISEPSNFRHLSSIGWNPNEASVKKFLNIYVINSNQCSLKFVTFLLNGENSSQLPVLRRVNSRTRKPLLL